MATFSTARYELRAARALVTGCASRRCAMIRPEAKYEKTP